jgi:hypothetical protein
MVAERVVDTEALKPEAEGPVELDGTRRPPCNHRALFRTPVTDP